MKLTLVKSKEEAKDTKSFYFEPEKPISWLPGQFFYITLPKLEVSDPRGPTRHFTNSLSPTEGNIIRVTTRIRDDSGFKQSLSRLKVGAEIEAGGPSGTFILDENEPGIHVLIAGGIGITPFRTFIKYTIDKKLTDTSLYLIYSNSTPEEITFRKELENWDKEYKNINVTMTVSRPEESKEKWTGLTGRIDEKMLKFLIAERKLPPKTTFWLAGPPPMVEAVEKSLGSLNITSDRVRSEKFTGY